MTVRPIADLVSELDRQVNYFPLSVAQIQLLTEVRVVLQDVKYEQDGRKGAEEKHAALMDIGKSAYASIAEMVAALNCDYDRLEELRDERSSSAFPSRVLVERENKDMPVIADGDNWWESQYESEAEELRELEEAAGDCEDRDAAYERIQEDPLSVEVRCAAWNNPTDYTAGEVKPDEFCILLATGGPAVRLCGDLDEHGQPTRAYLQVQAWFTPWTDYTDVDGSVLLTYAQQFFFGE